MSDSRLEKFIYAICSMDVSDLPVPLSRIEKLWNCLITGETPDFEPLSRNEKYLMAMLDRYDISNLPAPMSRGEKLLYKIAVGETDLSDVPGYLSRYEELLKYLIENGENSEDDFEYVLYTLNQSLYTLYTTAEKPVKSAILKGQTLVNLINYKGNFDGREINSDGTFKIDVTKPFQELIVGKEYTFIVYVSQTTVGNMSVVSVEFNDKDTGNKKALCTINNPINGVNKIKFTVPSDYGSYLHSYIKTSSISGNVTVKGMIIEGDLTQEDIPYFTGMQSVKMPVLTTNGKNLMPINSIVPKQWSDNILNHKICDIKLKPNTTYTFSNGFDGVSNTIRTRIYDDNNTMLAEVWGNQYKTFTTNTNENYWVLAYDFGDGNIIKDIQIEEGAVKTTYEPYKSNILTVNEDVELCGIGDIKDELDCLTGELVQKTEKIIFDGSEAWEIISSLEKDNTIFAQCYKYTRNNTNAISNMLDYVSSLDALDKRGFRFNHFFQIRLNKNEISNITNNAVKEWVSKNNINVVRVEEQTVKTVDLTVVDQDNQPTELGTFENVTHVSLEAENLIPEVEMEVATNLLEDTVFNLTDAFNTLYPTAEKPVKSAILTGQTLVNIVNNGNWVRGTGGDNNLFTQNISIKKGQIYTVIGKMESSDVLDSAGDAPAFRICTGTDKNGKSLFFIQQSDVVIKQAFTNNENDTIHLRFFNQKTNHKKLMIIEGDYTNIDIPYFEGMQSVKMPVLKATGKNLFGGSLIATSDARRFELKGLELVEGEKYALSYNCSKDGKKTHQLQYMTNSTANPTHLYSATTNTSEHKLYFTVPKDLTRLFIFTNDWNSALEHFSNIQIEQGTQATTYEPYKSNILTVNDDVTLRRIGEVKDELDCVTGEVTERIGYYKFTGDENFRIGNYYGDEIAFSITTTDYMTNPYFTTNGGDDCFALTTGFRFVGQSVHSSTEVSKNMCMSVHMGGTTYFRLRKDLLDTVDVDGFKKFIRNNPTEIVMKLSKESVKTVDLSVVNQDGNVTTLKTFDDTTHVLLNSEGLIPTAALTVKTKIPSASSTSLLMDDISTEQQQLETTIDEQSNNVDATMVATTEIFEETL